MRQRKIETQVSMGRASELLAIKTLIEKEGFSGARLVAFYDNLTDPKPDIIAWKDGKKHLIEVKSRSSCSYHSIPIWQKPEDIDGIFIYLYAVNKYVLLNPKEYYDYTNNKYKISLRKLKGWKDTVMPDDIKDLHIIRYNIGKAKGTYNKHEIY